MNKPTNEQIGTAIIDVYMAINRFQDLVYVPSYRGGNPPPSLMAEECMKRICSNDRNLLETKSLNTKDHLRFLIDMMQICIKNWKE